ncbi:MULTISPECIES: cobalt-precorrin-6A reductase [Marinobacter]|jgi:precorrin-6A/cobalt-precorrin-6A reductase|uniref:cobalt-precorrin-6A reductase n=1 Tax=Marinobacter sp. DUT-3 TaxID=3412036 RepID=UPI003D16AF0C
MIKVLILGGTTEAGVLAKALADARVPALYSYAGRVRSPKPQPIPVRTGGFGGPEGLAEFLRAEGFTHLVDATHPFAEQISRNAVLASAQSSIHLLALTRPPWQPVKGDHWQEVANVEAAVQALAGPRQRVMLAIGRQHLEAFQAQPQHHYVLRLVDEPAGPLPLPDCTVTVDRGPFTAKGDLALLKRHRIDRIVSKNAGGEGAAAKLVAARQLGLPVLMINRPALATRHEVHDVDQALHWLRHAVDLGV